MNAIERQSNLGQSLFEINTNTVRALTSLQIENATRYFETNREFAGRISEISSLSDYFGLQREYGEALWSGARSAIEAQMVLIREATTGTRDAVTTAFSTEEVAADSESATESSPVPVTKKVAKKKVAK
jgi:hypothetical protein